AATARKNGEAFAGAVRCGIMRDPMSVSACEYFSEDPYLTAELLKSCRTDDVGFVFTNSLGQGEYTDRIADERALNELYLFPLKKAGKFAAALQLDGGYLNGEKISASRACSDRLVKYVRSDAAVVTEYTCGAELNDFTGGAYILGADGAFKRELYKAVVDGKIIESKLDRSIERMLATAVNTYELYKKEPSERIANAAMPDISRASSVLLKNDGILPFAEKSSVALFGNAADFCDGAKFDIRPIARASDGRGAFNVFLITDYERDGIPNETCSAIAAVASTAPTAVVICGACACELGTLKNANAIIFCPACRDVANILDMITERAPQGRLPFTWCDKRSDYPCNGNICAKRGDFRYESMYNGYMLFGNFKSNVAFPFGHGLDYTDYEIGRVDLKSDGAKIAATFDVKNVGKRAGTAVCQAYLTAVNAPAYGLKKRLAAVERVKLEAGESKRVTMTADASDLAVYDAENACFVTLGGKYGVDIGLSSADIRASGEVKLIGTRSVACADEKSVPAYYAYGSAFEPTAPEIEKLLKVPFIKRSEPRAELAPQPSAVVAKAIKRAKKTAAKQVLPLIEHKIASTPKAYSPPLRKR
ncbi:MAG: fibronectin type III-like domain-contianing protein, partial [Clostridiales bacterium]|nr:fibronectin type III-like domain-contianing protein [Clostridiales bacterium]